MHEYSTKNESSLVLTLSKGNVPAFNSLYHKYSGRLYRFAYGYLKSEEEAEELVQEVFTIIWEKRKELKEDLSFKSFLFTIAFNIIRKHFRTKSYLSKYLKSGINSESNIQTLNNINYNSLYKFIFELVDQLPDRRKEIFVKSRVHGYSIKEISEELRISHKTVENQLTSSLKFIRTTLNRENDSFENI
jgi:RNA polymerase sigma-70 factor (family 1)